MLRRVTSRVRVTESKIQGKSTLFRGYELSGVNCTYAPKISLNKTYKLKPLSGILIVFGSIAVKGLSDNILKTIK